LHKILQLPVTTLEFPVELLQSALPAPLLRKQLVLRRFDLGFRRLRSVTSTTAARHS